MATERVTIALPAGFDPARHQQALTDLVAKTYGDGFELDNIDTDALTATASRQSSITEISTGTVSESFDIRLARGTLPAHGDRVATKLADQYPGHQMSRFDPYLGRATLTRMSEPEVRARAAVSIALGVKAWEVQVAATPDGGFTVNLPRSYVPSRHDDKLAEVASAIVGSPGWRFVTDPNALTARVIPGQPPTFPPVIPYPLEQPTADGGSTMSLGRALGVAGTQLGPEVRLNFDAGPHGLLSGTTGAGKSSLLNGTVFDQVAAGCELVIVDLPHKAVDFIWCKDFVRPGGWGCDSLEAAVTTIALIYGEGTRRARLLAQHQVTKIADLPPALRPRPVYILIDEVTGLIQPEEVPRGSPRTTRWSWRPTRSTCSRPPCWPRSRRSPPRCGSSGSG